MSIDNVKKQNSDQLRYWQNIQAKEKKLLNKGHENDIAKIKDVQSAETEQLRAEHRLQIIAEKERQESTLNRVRQDLDKTQGSLEKQKEFLTEQGQKSLAEKKINQENLWQNNEKAFEEKIEDQSLRQKDITIKANQTYNDRQEKQIMNQKDSLANLQNEHKNQLTEKAASLKNRTEYEIKVGDESVKTLKSGKKKEFDDEMFKWNHKIKQNSTSNQIEMKRQEQVWEKSFNDEINKHQAKYQNMLQLQKDEVKNQQTHFDQETARIKTEATTHLDHVMSKTSDPFYQNKSVAPKVTDLGDSYQIKIQVPEHEKDSYLLGANERTLTLSFSRNYKEDIKLDGQVSKTRRVESYNNSFEVPAIVKPNSLSKNYQDGELTFTIKKA